MKSTKTYDEDGNVTGQKPFDIGLWLILQDMQKACEEEAKSQAVEGSSETDNFTYPG